MRSVLSSAKADDGMCMLAKKKNSPINNRNLTISGTSIPPIGLECLSWCPLWLNLWFPRRSTALSLFDLGWSHPGGYLISHFNSRFNALCCR